VLNNVAGFPKSFSKFAHGNGRKKAAVIVNNNKIDAAAVKQVSEGDASLIEFSYKGLNFYGASLYFVIDRDMGRDIGKVEAIRKLTRGRGLFSPLIAIQVVNCGTTHIRINGAKTWKNL
jgi:hypothetical protein